MLGRVRPERLPVWLDFPTAQSRQAGDEQDWLQGRTRSTAPSTPGESCLPASWAQHCQLLPPNET